MRIVFLGCDDFALVCLKHLVEDGFQVAALVTQPDKPKGRGLHLGYSSTKTFALEAGIEVLQPVSLRDSAVIDRLRAYAADVFVVVAYGKFLPDEILALPRHYCVNVHPSLLPRYRGAAPVNWAVINGDTQTGVTLIKVSATMDGGDILAQEEHPIPADITSSALREQLAEKGAALLAGTLPLIPQGRLVLHPQHTGLVTQAPKMSRELGHIDWNKPARVIHNLVRGTQPWPGAYTFFRGGLLKVLETGVIDQGGPLSVPGSMIGIHPEGFLVQAGAGSVLIKKVHPASSRAMDARAFLAGHRLMAGEFFGS